jgi:tetratricopeptide (TPR) repeat protein
VRLPANQRAAFLAGANTHYKTVMNALSLVDAEKAQARSPQDRDNTLGAVHGSVCLAALNSAVSARLRNWYIATAASRCAQPAGPRCGPDTDEALSFFRKALDINRSTVGDKHTETAAAHNSMATVYNSQGKFDMALEH